MVDKIRDTALNFLLMNLCVVLFPPALPLFVITILVEFNMNLSRLFDRRLPVPTMRHQHLSRTGISVFQVTVHFSAATNAAILAYRTYLPEKLFGPKGPFEGLTEAEAGHRWLFLKASS